MLLENYELEIFNSKCNPGAMSVHCFAHLAQDVSDVLPYLNTLLGGFEYLRDPPSVTFKAQGKLIPIVRPVGSPPSWCLPHGSLKAPRAVKAAPSLPLMRDSLWTLIWAGSIFRIKAKIEALFLIV